MLTKKQDYLEKRIEQELTIAKKNGTKNKRGTNTHTYVFTYISICRCLLLASMGSMWSILDTF